VLRRPPLREPRREVLVRREVVERRAFRERLRPPLRPISE
jgi:hypothetical protein